MSAGAEVFIGRQPILDRDQRIVGYELLFRASREATYARIEDPVAASARVIVDTFASVGTESVLGEHLGFVNVTREMLLSGLVEALPRAHTVLEILENVPVDRRLIQRCQELRRAGFRLALDDYVGDDEREALFDLVDYVKVDFLRVDPRRLRWLVQRLRRGAARILAEKVEEREQYEFCRKLGFDLYQGYFFARPTVLTGRSLDPSRATLLRLLEQVEREADLSEIADTFKQHPNLGVNLLRIVNSAALARPCRIGTVRQAVAHLGLRQLRRWLLLLLFAGEDPAGLESPLLQTAALRGKLMELLVQRRKDLRDRAEVQDRAFLTGMLSLGDTLLGVTPPELLRQIRVESDIEEALLNRAGPLGGLLRLSERHEAADFGEVARLLAESGIDPHQLRQIEVEAYGWVHGLARSPFEDAGAQLSA